MITAWSPNNRALIKDLQERLRTDNVLNWVEREAATLARLGIVRAEAHVLLTNAVFRQRRVIEVFETSDRVARGRIRAVEGGFTISVLAWLDEPSRRCTLAHELGHTYWFAPDRSGRPLSPFQAALGSDPDIEYLCDRFASALLLPEDSVREWLHQKVFDATDTPDPASIQSVADRFVVTERTAARRIFHELWTTGFAVVRVDRRDDVGHVSRPAGNWRLGFALLPTGHRHRASNAGYRLPASCRRVIPDDMVPSGERGGCLLDDRWWTLLTQQPDAVSRRRMRDHKRNGKRHGYAFDAGERVYILVPMQH